MNTLNGPLVAPMCMATTLVLAAALGGCSNSSSDAAGCYRGGESARQAVSQLIEASVKDDSTSACQVVLSETTSLELSTNMEYIRSIVEQAGGMDQVAVNEADSWPVVPPDQVYLLIADSATSYPFDVFEKGGRYFVGAPIDTSGQSL